MPVGCEIETRSIGRPHRFVFVELAEGDLLHRRKSARSGERCRDRPDVRARSHVGVSAAVPAILRTGDHANIADVFFLRRVSGFLGRISFGLRSRVRCRVERDSASIRRPDRSPGSLRSVGERTCFAAVHRDQIDLRRLRFPIHRVGGPHESNLPTVGRPARRSVVATRCQRARRRASIRRHDEDLRLVAILFLVHVHAHEGDLRAVGRDLRIGGPDELEQVGFGNRSARLRCASARSRRNKDEKEAERE